MVAGELHRVLVPEFRGRVGVCEFTTELLVLDLEGRQALTDLLDSREVPTAPGGRRDKSGQKGATGTPGGTPSRNRRVGVARNLMI